MPDEFPPSTEQPSIPEMDDGGVTVADTQNPDTAPDSAFEWTVPTPLVELQRGPSRFDLPDRNLILTGFLGVGKTTIARRIARQLGVDLLDIDDEIELREVLSIAKIRELYGDSRLKSLEHDLCRRAALMRRSVIDVPGAALTDSRNFDLLTATGYVVVLTCELGEALRRMHQKSELHYRDRVTRGRMLGRMRREHEVVSDARLLQLDTTHLTIDEEVDLLIRYWATGEPPGSLFRYGPREPLRAPQRPVVGLTSSAPPTFPKLKK
ncbi:MAG: hypothetical protein IT326_09740 [Anaerolineae bacterium]|nr:hypothetical protein [Anaerolineae bacterium]